MLPYGRHSIDEADIEAVVAALRSDFLTTGPEVEAFEREFAAVVGARHAVAVCNATAALHLAMRVAGIGLGDRVVTSPNTFLASANCAAYVGATPDFCDIESVGYNMDPEILAMGWQPDTRAVVAVDYGGQPAHMPRIAEVARARGAVVIEDACHGVGGGFLRDGKAWKLGGHPWADMTVFSFHPVKTMTTGEGGMLVTDNAAYAEKARLLRSHGMVREQRAGGGNQGAGGRGQETGGRRQETGDRNQGTGGGGNLTPASCLLTPEKGPWYYEMQDLGYNYRITDIQCALGRSQLRRLPQFMARRGEIVAAYNKAFAALPHTQTPKLAPWLFPTPAPCPPTPESPISWHLYTLQIDFPAIGKTRTQVMNELRGRGVGTQVLYIPVHLQPWYRQTYGYAPGKCPRAEAYYERALSLPLFPAMNDDDVARVIKAVKTTLS